MTAAKQTGRRYGPAPKPAAKHRQAPRPMDAHRREAISRARTGRMTARQMRQFFRMGERNDGFLQLGHKPGFAPTPKQKKVRRDGRSD